MARSLVKRMEWQHRAIMIDIQGRSVGDEDTRVAEEGIREGEVCDAQSGVPITAGPRESWQGRGSAGEWELEVFALLVVEHNFFFLRPKVGQ